MESVLNMAARAAVIKAIPFRSFLAISRGGNWWNSKIPPLLAVGYAAILLHGLDARTALTALLALLIAICAVAAYGHVVNDVFDVEEDRRRGKNNSMARFSGVQRLAIAFLLVGMAFFPVLWVGFGPLAAVLLAVNLLLPTIYSARPFHLKERGLWGVVADTLGVHVIPAQFLLVSLTHIAVAPSQMTGALMITVGIWTFASGLRGIIGHQFADRESDMAAGVRTFGGMLDAEQIRLLVVQRIFPVEVISLVVFIGILLPVAPLFFAAVPIYLAHETAKLLAGWNLPMLEGQRAPYLPVANNHVFEITTAWVPVTLACQLALTSAALVVLPILQLTLFYENVRARVEWLPDLWRDLRDPRSRRRGRKRVRGAAILSWGLLRKHLSRHHALQRRHSMGNGKPIADADTNAVRKIEVFIGATYWTLNGVNIFSVNLVRGLRANGIDAKILLTEENTALVTPNEREMPRPSDIPFEELPVHRNASWGAHWGTMIRYLEERAPCIYVPNSDWRHSCVNPRLSDKVCVVGVVHSDDPLHYDHVARLGKYWNGIVTTSKAIAAKVTAADPGLAPRLTTIPIGVSIPPVMPEKVYRDDVPLRLIYHGVLKQYQKRILDLPRIVSACAERAIPIELTIAGGGPDERQLMEACEELVKRGLIRFLGVVPHDQILVILEQHDGYILTSEFEGMPNALLEAMGRGCVPLVTDMESGIPELVRNGHNGFLVPIGDIAAFADRIRLLQHDVTRRRAMAIAAHATVNGGAYSTDNMVHDYIKVFDRVVHEERRGIYKRPLAPMDAPPERVDGVSIFPIEVLHEEKGVGRFPTHADFRDFEYHLNLLRESQLSRWARIRRRIKQQLETRRLKSANIIVAVPCWSQHALNVQVEHLVRGLRREGLRARILLTETNTNLVSTNQPRMARPADIPMDELRVRRSAGWDARWRALVRYLERRAPCIYIPNHDWRHSCVSPVLSRRVHIVGVLHGDDPLHYDHAERLGQYWNAIVAGSRTIAQKAEAACPGLAKRMTTISYGVDVPEQMPERTFLPGATLKVVCICPGGYRQKESELAPILAGLAARKVPVEITLVSAYAVPRNAVTSHPVRFARLGSHAEQMRIIEGSDVLLVTSPFDGIYETMSQAMGRGCVPVVANLETGLPVEIEDGRTGFLVPPGDAQQFVECLALLQRDPQVRRNVASQAHKVARRAAFRIEDMISGYIDVFRRVLYEAKRGIYRRPKGTLQPPPTQVNGIDIFPYDLPHVGKR